MPSIVVIFLPSAADTGVPQERTGLPSRCTVQAPQSCAPHPNLVPVMPTVSRIAQSSGVLGSTSTLWVLPLIFRRAIAFLPEVASHEPVAGWLLTGGRLRLLCSRR